MISKKNQYGRQVQMDLETVMKEADFVIATGISYLLLHDEALLVAEQIGAVHMDMGKPPCKTPLAPDYIRKAAKKERLGFKRKKVRC